MSDEVAFRLLVATLALCALCLLGIVIEAGLGVIH